MKNIILIIIGLFIISTTIGQVTDLDKGGSLSTTDTLNVNIAGGSISTEDTLKVEIAVSDSLTYIESLNAKQVTRIDPIWARYTPSEPVETATALTATFVLANDSPIDMQGYKTLLVFTEWVYAAGGENLQVKAFGLSTETGSEYPFMIETVSSTNVAVEPEYIEFNTDVTQNAILKIQTDGVPYINLYKKSDGAFGTTAIYIVKVY